jgi:hypothetical protein
MSPLRLNPAPLDPTEALTLSYLVDTIDTLRWTHCGEAMVTLLNEEPFVPESPWSSDREPDQ